MPDVCLRDVVLHHTPLLPLLLAAVPPHGHGPAPSQEDGAPVLRHVVALSPLTQTAETDRPGLQTSEHGALGGRQVRLGGEAAGPDQPLVGEGQPAAVRDGAWEGGLGPGVPPGVVAPDGAPGDDVDGGAGDDQPRSLSTVLAVGEAVVGVDWTGPGQLSAPQSRARTRAPDSREDRPSEGTHSAPHLALAHLDERVPASSSLSYLLSSSPSSTST